MNSLAEALPAVRECDALVIGGGPAGSCLSRPSGAAAALRRFDRTMRTGRTLAAWRRRKRNIRSADALGGT
jgi:hypothetical protein